MSISKSKKIIIFFLLIIFCGSIILPASVLAVDQTISIQCYSINQNGTTKKWSLGFKISTTNVANGTKIYDYLYEDGINLTEGNKISTIKDDYAEYLTGQILDSETKYTVTATVVGTPKLTTSVSITTPKDGEQATSCTPSNPETSQTIKNTINTDKETNKETETTYTLLAPLPGLEGTIDTKISAENPCPFGNYLNIIIKLFLGVCAVLAVVMIVIGGIEYMTSDLVSSKESGKKMITNAILGLLLGLGAYVILSELNPDLLKVCLNSLPEVSMVADDNVPQSPINGKYCTNTYGTNGGYTAGADWSAIAGKASTLPSGVKTNNPECTKVGEKNCTSLRGLNLSTIKTIQSKCTSCGTITITGGTECWLHGGSKQKTTHHIKSPTIDLRLETKLDSYIKSGTKNGSWYKKDGILYLLESKHWHVGN
ncbi:MAG TPA: pilin [Candidatus Paceibacterota bacterium]|nr:pilin [Candidatus Paceibacterota bacterium]HPT18008.1 pilin [Candidatus Paceibacterota bacterium]